MSTVSRRGKWLAAGLVVLSAAIPRASCAGEEESRSKVTVLRAPDGGIQPQVAGDEKGGLHLIYFKGDPGHGDIVYVRSTNGGASFSSPIRANSHEGSAIAMGNIRGAQLAVGRGGRAHVAWMGSDQARPRGPGGETPMLYTRLNDAATAFEPERNVIQKRAGLDGGGSVAADKAGNVYVVWHAPDSGPRNEANRRVWVARSSDEGKTFAPEVLASTQPTGACACCGMRAFAGDQGALYVLYRAAAENVHRDMYLLASRNKGEGFQALKLQEWNVGKCVMSSASFAGDAAGILAAWETREQVYFARLQPGSSEPAKPIPAPGDAGGRKHPAVAVNSRGEVILAWTEGMGWARGGAAGWQVFDPSGRPIAGGSGRAEGVPTWSLVAVCARADGGFTLIY
jgi:hypothetical protein